MIRRSKDDVMIAMMKRLLDNSNNKFSITPTSTVRLMLESIAYEIARLNDVAAISIMDKTLQYASGENLDAFGVIFNIPRITATQAYDITESSIKFYIDPVLKWNAADLVAKIPTNITADTINRDEYLFIIKAGTKLYTEKSNITYSLVNDVTLYRDMTFAYGGAIADGTGSAFNIDINMIIGHNIAKNQPELENIAPFIFVTNVSPLDNGRDDEDDINYRARIRNAILSNASANEIALRFAALSVPGVAEARVIKHIDGIGTTGIEITTQDPVANPGVYRAVYDACSKVLAVGETVRIIEPEYVAVGIDITINGSSALDSRILDQIRNKIAQYIVNVPKGGTIYKNQIITIIMEYKEVIDVNIKSMFIGSLDLINGKLLNRYDIVPGNISSSVDEKFYTDTSLITICVGA